MNMRAACLALSAVISFSLWAWLALYSPMIAIGIILIPAVWAMFYEMFNQ
jgi:hypothetical protein